MDSISEAKSGDRIGATYANRSVGGLSPTLERTAGASLTEALWTT